VDRASPKCAAQNCNSQSSDQERSFHIDAVKRLRKRKRTTFNNSQQKALAMRGLADCSRLHLFCSHCFCLNHAMVSGSECLVIGAMKMKNSFESQLKLTERL